MYAKWYHDSIPCVPFETLVRKLSDLYKLVLEGNKRLKEEEKKGGGKRKIVEDYKELVSKKEQLFDIFPRNKYGEEDVERRRKVEEDWGVKMGKMERIYYEDMQNNREMECGKEIDPVWYQAMIQKQRQREREAVYRQQMEEQFMYQPMSRITEILKEDGALDKSDSGDSNDGEGLLSIEPIVEASLEGAGGDVTAKTKKKTFISKTNEKDLLPESMRHIRKSERKVRDDVYICLGNLIGEGLSINEASKALVEVGNGLFDRQWRLPDNSDTARLETVQGA